MCPEKNGVSTLSKPLQTLFDSYRLAFDSFDADAIATHYCLPSATCDGDGLRVFSRRTELVIKFEANCVGFKDMGYQSAKFSVVDWQQLSADRACVNLCWRIQLSNDFIEFCTMYACVLEASGWRVFSAVAYPAANAQAQFSQ
ncbi:MAG: hypothetical protein AB8B86_15510 [Pseudomonadales bacterium]